MNVSELIAQELILLEAAADIAKTAAKTIIAPVYNIGGYGVDGDGETNDSPLIQEIIDSMPDGSIIYFPNPVVSYKLDTNISFNNKSIMVMMDPGVVFSGSGNMPANMTNSGHPVRQNYYLYKPTGGIADKGYVTLTSEVAPDETFVGNAVAGYFGALSPTSGNGFIWGLNPIVVLQAGFGGNGIGVEVDLDNYDADYKGQGVLITGVGDHKPEVGCKITRADATSDWKQGIVINRSEIGILIDLSDAITAAYGISIKGISNNHIKLQPSDDLNPENALIYGVNTADDQVVFKVTKRGGIVLGGGTEVIKHISLNSPVLNFGSISAQSTSELTVTVTGAEIGDSAYATPSGALTSGCIYSAYVSATNTVTVRVANITSGSLDPDGGGGLVWRIDIWKH